jgi:hypothetical protein
MSCPPDATFDNDLLNWSVDVNMRGSYSASFNLTDEEDKWTEDAYLGKPVQIYLEAVATVLDGTPDGGLWEGTVRWVYGLVTGNDTNTAISEQARACKVSSFASRLGDKPVNTEKQSGGGQGVMESLAGESGGLPSGLYDFSGMYTNLQSYNSVSGDNLLEEMGRVATAAKSDLYVDRTGKLVATAWKDHNSAVDVVIPPQAVQDARRGRAVEGGSGGGGMPSNVRVRGKMQSPDHDCGEKDLGDSKRPDSKTPKGGGGRPGKGGVEKCIVVGKGVPGVLTKNRVDGNGVDADNSDAIYSWGQGAFVDPGTGNPVETDGLVTEEISGPGGGYIPAGTVSTKMERQGRTKGEINVQAAISKWSRGSKQKGKQEKKDKAKQRKLGGNPGGGGAGGGGKQNPDKNQDEPEPVQLETVVRDPDIAAKFGETDEDIDNPYISDKDTAFEVGVRRFQESKMQAKQWATKVSYLPSLNVGQVVTFTVPQTGQEVTGLLAAIKLGYDPAPAVSMDLTVESFEDLGNTDYESGNLLACDTINGGSMDGEGSVWKKDSRWNVRVGDHIATVRNGYNFWQELFLSEGAFTASITADADDGSGNLLIKDPGGATVASVALATGIVNVAFNVAAGAEGTYKFWIECTDGVVYVRSPSLVKTKTA